MESLISLTDPMGVLVADASAVINLNATGCTTEILKSLPNPVAVTDVVPGELKYGRQRGRRDADLLKELVSAGIVSIVKLNDAAALHFEQLVIGPAVSTLDDGEAATIAYAAANGGIAIIDERKAKRICSERFPSLRLACSVDILAHENVAREIGHMRLAQAVVNALQAARMRVQAHHMKWVLELIGPEQAAICSSLPNSVRLLARNIILQPDYRGML